MNSAFAQQPTLWQNSGTTKIKPSPSKIITTDKQIESTLAIGTSPLSITSTTKVSNLNADLLDDQSGSYYLDLSNMLAGTLAVDRGGTGQSTYTNGQLLIGNTTGNTLTKATLTGTANQVVVTNGAGSITLSTPQDIGTASTPTFGALIVNGLTAIEHTTASQFPCHISGTSTGTAITNVMGPIIANTNQTANNWMGIIFSDTAGGTSSALMGVQCTVHTTDYCRYGFASRAADGYLFRAGIDNQGLTVGSGFISHSGTHALALAGGSTSPTAATATADVVTLQGVDNGAGNRELYVQPESGGYVAYGADTLRRQPNANRSVDDRVKATTTTSGTQATLDTIAITSDSTYLIESRITARRTGGASGTADDGASYVRRGTYTTKSGTVTLMGSVQTIGTDAEDQAAWDATLDINSTNVRVRVTGAASNNISWMAQTTVQRIGQ